MKFCYALINPRTGNVVKEYTSFDSKQALNDLMLYHNVHNTRHNYYRIKIIDNNNMTIEERTEPMPDLRNPSIYNMYKLENNELSRSFSNFEQQLRNNGMINHDLIEKIYKECIRIKVNTDITNHFHYTIPINFNWYAKCVKYYNTNDKLCYIIRNL
jgi:hypothetical protein